MQLDEDCKRYKDSFAGYYHCPHIFKRLDQDGWTWKRENINDKRITSHLSCKSYSGVLASNYVDSGTLDLDNASQLFVDKVVETLGMSDNQFLATTSPSFFQDGGSRHLLFKPLYNGKPLRFLLYEKIMRCALKPRSGELEIFPASGRGCRLPFGYNQYVLDSCGIPIRQPWQERFYQFEDIIPFELKQLNKFCYPDKKLIPSPVTDHIEMLPEQQPGDKTNGSYLFEHGLQKPNSRHEATLQVAFYLFHRVVTKENAIPLMNDWITKRHNGFSDKVNKGMLEYCFQDNRKAIDWIWQKYSAIDYMPDGVLNKLLLSYEADISFIAEIFPGKIKQQRYLYNLINYYRPRARKHNSVFCSCKNWIDISSKGKYKSFQNELLRRNIIFINKAYCKGIKPRSISDFSLPDINNSERLMCDGRAVESYEQAVKLTCKTPEAATNLLGLPERTVNFIFNKV